MDKKNWFDVMGLADEKYVKEADPRKFRKRRASFVKIASLAACLAILVTGAALYLFIPFRTTPPDVSRYSGSEYYGIIMKLNEYTFAKPKYKNNFYKLTTSLKKLDFFPGLLGGAAAEDKAPTADNVAGVGKYEEVVDNQTTGVIEADKIKRSDTRAYYLNSDVLEIYSIEGEESRKLGEYPILSSKSFEGVSVSYLYEWEIYLSDDCTRVMVLAPCYKSDAPQVAIATLDVTNPEAVSEAAFATVSGSYYSSRSVGGDLLLLTEYSPKKSDIDFDDVRTFLPTVTVDGEEKPLPADMIVSPEVLTTLRYTVAVRLDGETLENEGAASFLSYSDDVYVSEGNVFASRSFTDAKEEGGYRTAKQCTEISAISYLDDTLSYLGSVVLEGTVKDRFSMSEYEGVLRVFTSTSETTQKLSTTVYNNEDISSSVSVGTQASANLYCVSLDDFSIISSVVGFAPMGESVESARFNGTEAYACTAIVVTLTDPVYFFDLTDIHNITYTDTGTIDGYSTSLIDFGEVLIGIGVGSSRESLKVEAYEEADGKVVSIDSYELESVDYSEEYKSYYIDRKAALIGIPIYRYTKSHTADTCYLLLLFDGYEFRELLMLECEGAAENVRGFLKGEYYYVFSSEGLSVQRVFGSDL